MNVHKNSFEIVDFFFFFFFFAVFQKLASQLWTKKASTGISKTSITLEQSQRY